MSRKNGSLRWKFPTEGGICVTPTLWKDSVIFGSQDFNVYSIVTGHRNGKLALPHLAPSPLVTANL